MADEWQNRYRLEGMIARADVFLQAAAEEVLVANWCWDEVRPRRLTRAELLTIFLDTAAEAFDRAYPRTGRRRASGTAKSPAIDCSRLFRNPPKRTEGSQS